MGKWVTKYWRRAGAAIAFVVALWRLFLDLLDWAGRLDLLIAHAHDPGWIGTVIALALNPPSWISLPAIIIGLLLLYLDNRRHRNPAPTEAVAESRLVPNWPIRDLFFHIDPSILKNPYRDPEREVGRDVLDHLATGQLHAWGRPTGGNGALVPIPQGFWKVGEWVMPFFGEDDAEQVHARYPASNDGFRNVQFNRAEALAIWPKSIKTAWPDYQHWDKVDPLEVFQAACLWADEEPKLPWPSWGAEKVYRKINEYGHRPDTILSVSSGESTREAIVEAIETQRSGLVNPRGRIPRDDLKRIAEAWGEKPKFLYPRSRM